MKKPRRISTATILPVVLAVVATGAFGWWYKQQAIYHQMMRRDWRGRRLPEVSLQMQAAGSGSYENLPSGAWMRFRVLDDGYRRLTQSRRTYGVVFKAVDELQQPWRVEQDFVHRELVAYIPIGYARLPRRLTLTAEVRGKKLGAWKLPALAEPLRVLTAEDIRDAPFKIRWLLDNNGRDAWTLDLQKALAPDEMLTAKLVGLTYGKVAQPKETVFIPEGPRSIIELPLVDGTAGIDLAQIEIARYKAYRVQKTFDLSGSTTRIIQNQALLSPRPAALVVSPDLTLKLTSQPTPGSYRENDPNLRLGIRSDDRVLSFDAKVVPQVYRGMAVHLYTQIPVAGAHRLPETPRLPAPAELYEGPLPIKLIIDAQPYRLISRTTHVVPVPAKP